MVEMSDWKVFSPDEQDLHAAASGGCGKGLFTVGWRRDQAYERESTRGTFLHFFTRDVLRS
jgi:hypothetical protein